MPLAFYQKEEQFFLTTSVRKNKDTNGFHLDPIGGELKIRRNRRKGKNEAATVSCQTTTKLMLDSSLARSADFP